MAQVNQGRYKKTGGTSGQVYAARDDGLYYDVTTDKFVIFKNGAPYAGSGQVLIGDGTDLVPVTLSGDITVSAAGVITIGAARVTNAMLAKPRMRCIEVALLASELTDGGAAVGTKSLAVAIPAGARFLFTTIDTIVAFAGDVSAVITLGDGVDADRYNTGTPSVFTTAAAGVDMGAPSGTAFHAAAIANVVATVTSAADITPVLAGGGSCNLKFWFLEPI